MEKPAKSKNMILKFLPKAASVINFQNSTPFSPGRDHKRSSDSTNKFKAHGAGRGFSGPMISMIPVEAHWRSRSGNFDRQEPTSPKVSCMGQVKDKHKKRIPKTKRASPPKESKPREMKKQHSTLRRIFRSSNSGRKSDASSDDKPSLPDRAPSLGQMKRFSSGRNAFSNFDWTAPVAPVDSDHRSYYSDEERGDFEEEDEEFIIPFSAPILVGGAVALEPRKEINLWKTRTLVPPRPLRLNTIVK